MAESGAGTNPQVFVVDSQACYVPLPNGSNRRRKRLGQRFVHLLVGLAMLGLVVQGCFIYKLYNKAEGGTSMSRAGEINAIHQLPNGRYFTQIQDKPCAHLLGSSKAVGKDKVVQWENNVTNSFTHLMVYYNGRLFVQEKGYYYIYSKVHLNAAAKCSLIKHKVIKHTEAYGKPIDLMKSNSLHCHPSSTEDHPTDPDAQELWDSFLGGTFLLESQDEIFVTLEDGRKILPGPTYNFMGAFMISSLPES
ncbi:tumor necrosis factor ligand superfamily member 14-like [Genypterus blacodes]|uniref:tumor necrosis factor ligand superfamily member 14-like n=1 Tax=Genypterus blacodes TaxID=154954 RepID=UPI003F771C76